MNKLLKQLLSEKSIPDEIVIQVNGNQRFIWKSRPPYTTRPQDETPTRQARLIAYGAYRWYDVPLDSDPDTHLEYVKKTLAAKAKAKRLERRQEEAQS